MTTTVLFLIALALFFDFPTLPRFSNSIATDISTRVLHRAMRNLGAFSTSSPFFFSACTWRTPWAKASRRHRRRSGHHFRTLFRGAPGIIPVFRFTHELVARAHGRIDRCVAGQGGWEHCILGIGKTVAFIFISPLSGCTGYADRGHSSTGLLGTTHRCRWTTCSGGTTAFGGPVQLGHGGTTAQRPWDNNRAAFQHRDARRYLPVPLWVVLSCHAAIAAGTLSGGGASSRHGAEVTSSAGRRFLRRVQRRVSLFISSALGVPVSTTIPHRFHHWGSDPRSFRPSAGAWPGRSYGPGYSPFRAPRLSRSPITSR